MTPEILFAITLATTVNMFSHIDGFRVSNYFKDMQASVGDSDTYLTPPQIIRKYGYPAEAHTIKSADGYLLELHRIPYGKAGPGDKKRIPVFLHHGLLCSSIDWIINGPNKSLGYRLADEGYDVWLANARGNTFSRGHVKYSPSQREFWDYSFHEMGIYDLPAAIDHILKTTDQEQLVYIGHSLGTTVFYVMASTLPEYNRKIKFQISMGPVTGLGHTTSAFRLLVPYAHMIHDMSDWYNKGAFLEHDLMTKIFLKVFCGKEYFKMNICEQVVIFRLFGKDPEQFQLSLVPIMSSNMPAGTSGKNMIHCSQLISSGEFQNYDYGKAGNVQKYHTASPPKYNFSNITVPVRVYYGENDILSDPLDTKLMYQKLPKPLGLVRVNYDKFNHVDFLWSRDINKLLNDEVIQFINNSTDYYYGSDFIQDNVQRALEVRASTPPPVNVPFNEQSYFDKFQNTFVAGASGMTAVDFTKYPAMAHEQVVKGLDQAKSEITNAMATANKAVEGAVMQTVREVHSTGDKVNGIVQEQIANTKFAVEKTKSDLQNKIKESLDNLERLFG